ncbi:MAG: DHHA1 domain-containing protein, partial [Candidatus Paceibacteria bacterium]
KKIIGIYHKDCPDGITGAAVLLRKFPDIELFSLPHPFKEEDLKDALEAAASDSEVYFVDYAIGVEKFLSDDRKVFVVDHHIGLKDKLNELAKENESLTFVFDNDKSGASLAWSYLFPDEQIPEVIKYVEDVDLWTLKYGDDTKYVSNYLSTHINTPEQMLDLIENGDIEEIKKKGKIMSDYSDVQINRFLDQAEKIELKIDGHIVPAYNIPMMYKSGLGNKLSEKEDKAVALFAINGDKVKVSFRSKDAHNPSSMELAKNLGGGGHRNAASTFISLEDFIKML